MSTPESFVSTLEGRNQTSIERLLPQLDEAVRAAEVDVVGLLRLEARHTVETIDATAMWLVESDSLQFKLALSAHCGSCAQRYSLLDDRLRSLGVPAGDFDPLCLGYSKLFAFFRSLQTTEERAAAGALTAGAYAVARFQAISARAETTGDLDTSRLFATLLPDTEREHMHAARLALLAHSKSEEAQARARRAAFRTVELLGELQDPGLFKKFLSRSLKKPTG